MQKGSDGRVRAFWDFKKEYVAGMGDGMNDLQSRDTDETMHLAEGFRRMVHQQAILSWKRLPSHTRYWLSVEDLVSDGMFWVVMRGIPRWDQRRGALSTFIHVGVRNHFDEIYEGCYLAKKRHEGLTTSLQELLLRGDDEKRRSDTLVIADKLGDVSEPERIIRDCYVADIIKDIYDVGSRNLQMEIRRWFFSGEMRIRLNGEKFIKATTEFRGLALGKHLHYEECRHLLHSPVCLDKLSRGIMDVPYDLDHPTPGLRYGGQ